MIPSFLIQISPGNENDFQLNLTTDAMTYQVPIIQRKKLHGITKHAIIVTAKINETKLLINSKTTIE